LLTGAKSAIYDCLVLHVWMALDGCVILCRADEIRVRRVNGLRELSVPMPSRKVICRFTLRSYAHTLGDLISSVLAEDEAIHRVHAENEGNLHFLLHTAKHLSQPRV